MSLERHDAAPDAAGALERRFQAGSATIGVIGLGYVGLPLALAFAEAGFDVLGFDTDPDKLAALARGESYLTHLPASEVSAAVNAGRLTPVADSERLGEPDAILICVPTPLGEDRQPDLGHVIATGGKIGERLRRGQLVVLESTTYPGTTEEVLEPLLSASGLTCGRDYFLAYSPEREDPGNPEHASTRVPKVVGGADEASAALATALYRRVVPRVVRVSGTRVAEATKLFENVFRAVNIALVNELKLVYERLGIDIWEVLDAAATKPFGFMRFDPGPGWGGHCIPIDPFYLAWKARQAGTTARFVELAGEVNIEMPAHVVARLADALRHRNKDLAGSSILVLGLAYKRNVGDPRESPAFEILDRLIAAGARVAYHDPHVPRAPRMRSWSDLPDLESQPLTPQTVAAHDAVVLVTDHDAVDYELVLAHAPLIIDTRGALRGRAGGDSERVVPA